ncbi:MAG: hypothetical protein IT559_03180 [Alphaproteobacteria bacterium]|nr:hypothetical protein [Alphaproteobacteria bacterium]
MKGEALCEALEPRERLLEILREVGGHAFSYQYLQGLRRPQFGTEGEGCVLVTPYRKGAFYDGRKTPGNTGGAFFRLREEDLILPRVFGIGDDPLPPDRRSHMSEEEWVHAYGSLKFDPQTGQHFIDETR